MSKPAASCNMILDCNGQITSLVCQGLGFDEQWLGNHYTIGFVVSGKIIGGLIYHDIRAGQDLWWTIYTSDKRWCNRRILTAVFSLAFDYFKAKRINLLVNTDNIACINLVEKLGFVREGKLRHFRDDGADCYFYGMLTTENKWKGKHK